MDARRKKTMSEYLETSESIAREAHAGQLYGDRDYIEAHVAPVVGMIARLGYGDEYQATGWLHDVFEDSGITPEDALQRGIPRRIVTAAELLTKDETDSHETYLDNIATDSLAVVVKFADSSLNYVSSVLYPENFTPETFQRYVTKYAHNIAYLNHLLPKP